MGSHQSAFPDVLSQVLQSDVHRLKRKWRGLRHDGSDESRLSQWRAQADESAALVSRRDASVPELSFDAELPISDHREEIIDLLRQHQVIVVCGETGSGKSTQLPKICLEAGYGRRGMIGHTQPRRLAARAVSTRLAEELGSRVGEKVGFKVRFTDTTGQDTLVKLMTDGILLAETQTDRFLDKYDVLIVDEAHERSLNIDFLLGYLRNISAKRPDLRIIITSATIDPAKFAEHFSGEHGPAPIVEVSGRTYPVETRYRPINDEVSDEETARLVALADASDELVIEGQGDILVFLPTERDIRLAAKHLRGHYTRHGEPVEILPLYARLSQAEQDRIFRTGGSRRIVLSTNVAESSLTVPGIRYVIDTGLVRISRYAARSRVRRLPIEDVSQASADQRKGRCGRLGPGVCIRLFSEEDFASRPRFTTPEIRRSDLASVLLQSKVLRLGSLESFPLLDPPTPESLRDANKTLREIEAIDQHGKLTDIGRWLGKLPCDPRTGRILWEGNQQRCLAEVVVIAAALEGQDVRQRPAGKKDQADEAHRKFMDPHSDFLSYLRVWQFYENLRDSVGRSRQKKSLQQNFLSPQGMREWADMVRQFRQLLRDTGMKVGNPKIRLEQVDWEAIEEEDERQRTGKKRRELIGAPKKKIQRPEGYEAIHRCLLKGMLQGIANLGDRHEYKAIGGLSVSLWPGSGLFRRKPKWIIASEIVETSKRYARTIAQVEVDWIQWAAEDLLKYSYNDPHWSSKSGSAMVYRKSSLYGLTIEPGRRVQLAPIDRSAARQLMIEHGLVAGEWRFQAAFYQHNQELIADMEELARRTRSRAYIVDRYDLMNFYQARIPEEVSDAVGLKRWCKDHRGSEQEKRLWMQPEDLLPADQGLESIDQEFPNEISVGPTALPVEYHFEPGHNQDGVTVTVPQAALRQVSDESLGWLVPGLIEEKVLHLIKSLPKSLRTNFVPAPDVAKKIAQQLSGADRTVGFMETLCRLLREHSGERIGSDAFDHGKLPEHLRMLVRVVDDEGQLVAEGRDVQQLQSEHAGPAAVEEVAVDECDDWQNKIVRPDTFEDFPEQVQVIRGGVRVAAFPTLVPTENGVSLQLVDNKDDSERLGAAGLVDLFCQKHRRSLRGQVGNLPNVGQARIKLGHLIPAKQFDKAIEQLICRIALIDQQPAIRSKVDFEARNASAVRQISIATQEVAGWLPKFADHSHNVRKHRESAPQMWSDVFNDITDQFEWLFVEDFLTTTPWQWLKEYPRYLQAIDGRIEKLRSGGVAKDKKLREPADRLTQILDEAWETTSHDPAKIAQARWMVEELRVSIFAQQLGTKFSVSEKRILNSLNN